MLRAFTTPSLAAIAAAMMAPSIASSVLAAQPAEGFRFEAIDSLEEMHRHVNGAFRVGAPRDALRRHFVGDGGATLIQHPSRAGVEKYVYDIDLCGFYVWRWNISADYDPQGRVRQVYVNGETALADGESEPAFDPGTAREGQSRIFLMNRPRPEASRGESSLSFVLIDADSDLSTIGDQRLIGAGPSRPHPAEMGRLHSYRVDPWRSIFDSDAAARIVPYSGDCAAAEQALAERSRERR